ncbi:hypothetical protein CD928_02980 [Sphingopyxis sp. GW247-27LB]|nr:hypothetical protein CD928_02980 [Sphingopyxis sp. GW247-27LB]
MAGLLLLALSALAGCGQKETVPISQLIASDTQNPELLEAFGDRLDFLSHDRALMAKEMRASGFELKNRGVGCGAWELPENPKRTRAFVQFCEAENGSVVYTRYGISRKSMTYD